MKTIQTTVYEFDELNDDAKEKAREWFREHALDYDWWESIYEDAANIGLRITSFDLERNRHAKGEFKFFGGASQCAGLILTEHGKDCETFKTATAFLKDLEALNKACAEVDGDDETNAEFEAWQDKRGLLEQDFERSLLEDYSIILQKEYEYQLSNEQVDESIRANEYTFTETGKRF
jgi:hypothetical protein